MKIVIEIDERIIERIRNQELPLSEVDTICKSILDGEPLPKNHGDLIDKGKLQYKFDWLEKVTNESSIVEKAEHEKLMECIRILESAPTIIEAEVSK